MGFVVREMLYQDWVCFNFNFNSPLVLELEFGVGGKLLAVTAEDGTLAVLSAAGKNEVWALSWKLYVIEVLADCDEAMVFVGHLM